MTFLITDDHRSFTMGRAPTSDIVINDPRASRSQVRINVVPIDSDSTNYQVELVDTSTLKNTFVNGHRIDRAVLQNQDMVHVAEHTFVFYFVGA
jgi:pSer/pThr/pTyr-binding forkhead associated (FHA) protein